MCSKETSVSFKMVRWHGFQKMANFDFQHLILKPVLIKNYGSIFSQNVQFLLLVLFKEVNAKKRLFSKHRSKFCRLAIIPFQHISKNPLEHFTFRQKSIGFCIPERETPQPVLPQGVMQEVVTLLIPFIRAGQEGLSASMANMSSWFIIMGVSKRGLDISKGW